MRNIFIAIVTFIIVTGVSNAQTYKFQQYGISKGLCHPFIYAINQDKNGFIWFATGTGLCRYDGFQFTSPKEDFLPSSNATTAFKDAEGNLWFGYNDGYVVKYNGYRFSVVDTSFNNTTINQIIQAPKGEMIIATQAEGITRISDKVEYLKEGLEDRLIYSVCFTEDNKLLVGCLDGLYLYNYQNKASKLELISKIDSIPETNIKSIIPSMVDNSYWIATEDEGIYILSLSGNQYNARRLDIPELDEGRVQSVYEDSQNNLWISTFRKGLFRVRISPQLTPEKVFNYNETNGLGSSNIKQIFFDSQQNLWVGTYGQGVSSLTNLAFSFIESLKPISNNDVTAVLSINDSEYWIAGLGTIIRKASNPDETTVYTQSNGLPNDRVTALHLDEHGDLWIGTEKSGLYKMGRNTDRIIPYFQSQNSLSNMVQAITYLDDEVWFASRNGVQIINTKTGERDQINTVDGLPHNNIRDIYKDSDQTIWVATNSNSIIAVNEEKRYTIEEETEIEFSSITKDAKGSLWAGTYGRGIFFFDAENDSIYHLGTNDGLLSDYCYAVTFDGQNHIWVGHRLGLSRINIHRLTVTTFGPENGLTGDVNPNAMIINQSGEMLVGMTDGVLLYNMLADRTQSQAPLLNLTNVTIGDKAYNPYLPIILPYDRYKVIFNFIGIQYNNPESVTYQYMLKDYDQDWSDPTNLGVATYPRLEDGEYTFWVKACNSDNCSEEILMFSIKIRKPFWKTWWFILISLGAAIGSVYLIIVIRERNHRIQQERLETELAARTKEVREQKEEIELKNRDITDSINYAQRIQFSVLPSTSTLLNHCSEAFIFYRPRDIVSGDFYWFDYFPDTHRLLIVCADSTGHGVPGAFMSLIGTTLLKDIAIREDVNSPADILYRLDENIQSTLNQNQESEQANDGMDIIVCEIDTLTLKTRIASAMRPYIVYRNGEPIIFKGSRSSIGGQLSTEQKMFELSEIQLSKGDSIYMFTDGYPDQFGGPSGKKFKMNRLQSIIDDINQRPMDEQYRVIKENFDLWKGYSEQIDDVLMIGIRI